MTNSAGGEVEEPEIKFLLEKVGVSLDILNNIPAIIFIKDLLGRYLFINKTCSEFIAISAKNVIGKTSWEILPEYFAEEIEKNDLKVPETLKSHTVEETIGFKNNFKNVLSVQFPLIDGKGRPHAICGISTDITNLKKAKIELEKEKKDLEIRVNNKTAEVADLNSKNIALQEILHQIEYEKSELIKATDFNIKRFIMPLLMKMKRKTSSFDKQYIELLEQNLFDINSKMEHNLSETFSQLTPRENEICNYVKAAYSNKEIADKLNLSVRTIEAHRLKIRKKLRLPSQQTHLSTFLKTL